jgi:hypothetical protein
MDRYIGIGDAAKLHPELYRAAKNHARKTVAYARVSSNDTDGQQAA